MSGINHYCLDHHREGTVWHGQPPVSLAGGATRSALTAPNSAARPQTLAIWPAACVLVFKEEGNTASVSTSAGTVTHIAHLERDDERGVAVQGSQWYRRPYKVHRQVGTDNASYVCPAASARNALSVSIASTRETTAATGRTRRSRRCGRATARCIMSCRSAIRSLTSARTLGHQQFLLLAKAKQRDRGKPRVWRLPRLVNGLTLKILV